MPRLINAIWLEITTGCNRRCPDCCCGVGRRPVVHHPWEYFEDLARVTGKFRHLHLTGGEPLFHPQFDDFAPRWRGLFGIERLTVWTNGYRAREHEAALANFDLIWGTKYNGDNADEIAWLVKRFKITYWEGPHIPISRPGPGRPCGRGLTDAMAAYANGRFYPCCQGPGIPGAKSLEPCADWTTRVLDVPLPCGECVFSE